MSPTHRVIRLAAGPSGHARFTVGRPAPRRFRRLASCLMLCLAVGLALAAPDPAPAQDAPPRPRVVVATLSDFPPYCFAIPGSHPLASELVPVGADSTQIQGFTWDVVRDSLHAAGLDIELKVAPWARAIHYLNSGLADLVFPAMRTPQREAVYSFSRQAVIRSTLRMYVRADSAETWTGLAAWAGREVAVIQGWAYGPEWEKHTDIVKHSVFSVDQGFAMLEKDRVAGVAGYEVPFDLLLRSKGMSDRFRKLPPWDVVDEYVIALKAAPRAAEHLDAFDRGMKSIQKNGRLEILYTKWNIPPTSQTTR